MEYNKKISPHDTLKEWTKVQPIINSSFENKPQEVKMFLEALRAYLICRNPLRKVYCIQNDLLAQDLREMFGALYDEKLNAFKLEPWDVKENDKKDLERDLEEVMQTIRNMEPTVFEAIIFDLFEGSSKRSYENFKYNAQEFNIESPYIILSVKSSDAIDQVQNSYINILKGLFAVGLVALKATQEEETFSKSQHNKGINIYLYLLDQGSINTIGTHNNLRFLDSYDLIKKFDFGMHVQPYSVYFNNPNNLIHLLTVNYIRRVYISPQIQAQNNVLNEGLERIEFMPQNQLQNNSVLINIGQNVAQNEQLGMNLDDNYENLRALRLGNDNDLVVDPESNIIRNIRPNQLVNQFTLTLINDQLQQNTGDLLANEPNLLNQNQYVLNLNEGLFDGDIRNANAAHDNEVIVVNNQNINAIEPGVAIERVNEDLETKIRRIVREEINEIVDSKITTAMNQLKIELVDVIKKSIEDLKQELNILK